MEDEQQLTHNRGKLTTSSLRNGTKGITGDGINPSKLSRQLSEETAIAHPPGDRAFRTVHSPQDQSVTQDFVLTRRNPQGSSLVGSISSRPGHNSLSEPVLASGTDAQGVSTGLQAASPQPATQTRGEQGSAARAFSPNSRLRISLPSWSEIPLKQQTELRSIARKFELIDRVLSTCIYNNDVFTEMQQVSLSDQWQPAAGTTIAKFRLACKDRLQTAKQTASIFQFKNFLTSPDGDKFFHHASEDLLSYLANQSDIPYWKVVLNWLAAAYRNQDGAYNFVRLIIYALESLTRSILEDLRSSGFRATANKVIVDGINCRLISLFGLLDDVFPQTLQSWSSYNSWLEGMSQAQSENGLALQEPAQTPKNSNQEV
jgi:hypothetical protein